MAGWLLGILVLWDEFWREIFWPIAASYHRVQKAAEQVQIDEVIKEVEADPRAFAVKALSHRLKR